MKKLNLVLLTAVVAIAFAACGGTADNKTAANTDAGAKAAPPTKEALVALDKQANQAWIEHDTKFFEPFLSDNFVGFADGARTDKQAALKDIAEHKCDVKSFTMDDARMQLVNNDVAVLVYKATFDGTCEGKKLPDVRASTVFVRRFEIFQAVYHSEAQIAAAPAGDKKADAKADDKKAEAKPGDKKAEPAPAGKSPANRGPGTETAAANAANKPAEPGGEAAATPPPLPAVSKPSADPVLTEQLFAVEKSGWEAWMAKDAKKLDEITTKDVTLVDTAGMATADKAATLKAWAEPCTITSVDVSDPYSVSLTTDVALLTYKGTAAGTCGSQKLVPIWGLTVFVRDGNWKAAFIAEMPAGK